MDPFAVSFSGWVPAVEDFARAFRGWTPVIAPGPQAAGPVAHEIFSSAALGQVFRSTAQSRVLQG